MVYFPVGQLAEMTGVSWLTETEFGFATEKIASCVGPSTYIWRTNFRGKQGHEILN